MPKLLLLALAAVTVTACVPPAGGLTEDDVAGRWVLAEGTVEDSAFPFAPDRRVTLRLDANGDLGGEAGCNSYSGSYDLVSGFFELGAEIAMTAMSCAPPVNLAEETYLVGLRLVDSADITDDGRLRLFGEDADLLFDPVTELDPQALVGRWDVVEVTGDGGTIPTTGDPFIEFTADQTMTGSTGCRALMGRFVIQGDEVLMTEMSSPGECPAAQAEQDGLIVTVLGDGFVARYEASTATLISEGDSLALVRG